MHVCNYECVYVIMYVWACIYIYIYMGEYVNASITEIVFEAPLVMQSCKNHVKRKGFIETDTPPKLQKSREPIGYARKQ